MKEFSLLLGGKAGDGIDRAGLILARILARLGYRIYIYRDYPSIIRGGHTFSIIRASQEKVTAYREKVDFMLALNQQTLDLHQNRLKRDCLFLYDSDQIKSKDNFICGIGLAVGQILKEENAPPLMRNVCLIGGFCKAVGIKWDVLEEVLRKEIPSQIDLNLKVARRGYDESKEISKIDELGQGSLPLVNGNEAMALGLVKAGLKAYIAYPMTPSSGILHFLAQIASDFSLKVIHPESEIAVMLMGLGFAYAGEKVAVGTSGGGFCLMTEGLSFAGMGELPIVIIVGQRTGPSTGLPTYTGQSDLNFVLNAGHGEFPRLVVAPGDAEEAYFWAAASLNIAWKYQIPAIILSDKTLSEDNYSFDMQILEKIEEEEPLLWDKESPYKRYLDSETGISPLAFVPQKDAIIKVNSYEHDEFGITTEDARIATLMRQKRLRKEKYLANELERYEVVKIHGHKDSPVALLCWGSNKGVCVEIANHLGLKVIQPLVISPFPIKQFKEAIAGIKTLISVECNALAQLTGLVRGHGFKVEENILKYDGRPFSYDKLEEEVKRLLR